MICLHRTATSRTKVEVLRSVGKWLSHCNVSLQAPCHELRQHNFPVKIAEETVLMITTVLSIPYTALPYRKAATAPFLSWSSQHDAHKCFT